MHFIFSAFLMFEFFSPLDDFFFFFFAPRLPSSVCTSHGSNLKSVTLILFHLTTVSVLIIKKLLKSPFAFIYLFSIVLLSRAVRLVVPFLSPPTIKMWSISHLFPTLAVSIYNDKSSFSSNVLQTSAIRKQLLCCDITCCSSYFSCK